MITTFCPQCHTEVTLDPSPEIGQRVSCGTCATILEIIWLYPLSLDFPEDREQPASSNDPQPNGDELSFLG